MRSHVIRSERDQATLGMAGVRYSKQQGETRENIGKKIQSEVFHDQRHGA